MKFNEAVISAFRSFAVFKGRAGRSEFWYFVLFFCGGVLTAATIDILLDRTSGEHLGPITAIFILVSLLPYYAVSVRRLHDIDRSGWFALIGAIPIPGYILLIYWYCQPGSSGSNRFGSHVATTRPGEALASMTGSSTDVVTASPVTPTKSAKTVMTYLGIAALAATALIALAANSNDGSPLAVAEQPVTIGAYWKAVETGASRSRLDGMYVAMMRLPTVAELGSSTGRDPASSKLLLRTLQEQHLSVSPHRNGVKVRPFSGPFAIGD